MTCFFRIRIAHSAKNAVWMTFLPRFPVRALAAALFLLVSACGPGRLEQPAVETPTPIMVVEYSAPGSLVFHHPMEWSTTILTTGMIVIAPSEVLNLEQPGPSVTVFRVAPGLSESSLALSLDKFLERGPLNENFRLTSDIRERQIGQYTGLSVDMERAQSEDLDALRGHIVAAEVDSGATYYIMATAPSLDWSRHWPLMQVIYQSVEFNE